MQPGRRFVVTQVYHTWLPGRADLLLLYHRSQQIHNLDIACEKPTHTFEWLTHSPLWATLSDDLDNHDSQRNRRKRGVMQTDGEIA